MIPQVCDGFRDCAGVKISRYMRIDEHSGGQYVDPPPCWVIAAVRKISHLGQRNTRIALIYGMGPYTAAWQRPNVVLAVEEQYREPVT